MSIEFFNENYLNLDVNYNHHAANTIAIFLYLTVYLSATFIIFLVTYNLSLKTNNILEVIKELYYKKSTYFLYVSPLLFLIGIPPFSGFIVKFLVFVTFSSKNNIFFIFLYFLIIILSTFFYLQLLKLIKNFKPVYSDFQKHKKFVKTNSILTSSHNYKIFSLQVYIIFFNIFFFIFYKDVYLILNLFF